MADRQRFQNLEREYDYRDYANKVRSISDIVRAKSLGETQKLAKSRAALERWEAIQKANATERGLEIEEDYKQGTIQNKETELANKLKAAGLTAEAAARIAEAKAASDIYKTAANKKPYYELNFMTDEGIGKIPFKNEGELSGLYNAIMTEDKFDDLTASEDIKRIMNQYEGSPRADMMKALVNTLWQKSPKAKAYVRALLDARRNANAAMAEEDAKPDTVNTPDKGQIDTAISGQSTPDTTMYEEQPYKFTF
jgi:hypothetical protein